MKKFIIVAITLVSSYITHAQTKLGNFYLTWGYHRDHYTKSDIHFKGNQTDNFDFTLAKAKATDRLDGNDFFHTPLTVPQYVLNVGYFFSDKSKWGIEGSWDHLKYIVIDNQTMHLTGQIHGTTFNQDSLVTPNFVHFEHTNGNNYAMISAVRRFFLLGGENKRVYRLSFLTKAGAGALVPKTDSKIMGHHNDGPFRFSGFVIGVSANLRFDFCRYLFIETGIKGAFADYTNAKLYEQARAKQTFLSYQLIGAAGFNIPLGR